YNIWRSGKSGAAFDRIATVMETTSYVDIGGRNGTTYFYVVTAVHEVGESSPSREARATPIPPPVPPTGLTAKGGNAQISLSWTAWLGAASYRVKRSTLDEGPFVTIGASETTSYLDKGVQNGTPYHYAVMAVNPSGESPDSPRASATAIAPPAAPAGFAA